MPSLEETWAYVCKLQAESIRLRHESETILGGLVLLSDLNESAASWVLTSRSQHKRARANSYAANAGLLWAEAVVKHCGPSTLILYDGYNCTVDGVQYKFTNDEVKGVENTHKPFGSYANSIGHWSEGPETFVIVKAKDLKLGCQTYGFSNGLLKTEEE